MAQAIIKFVFVTGTAPVATEGVRVCVELLIFHCDDKRECVLIGLNTNKLRVNDDTSHGIILSEWLVVN